MSPVDWKQRDFEELTMVILCHELVSEMVGVNIELDLE